MIDFQWTNYSEAVKDLEKLDNTIDDCVGINQLQAIWTAEQKLKSSEGDDAAWKLAVGEFNEVVKKAQTIATVSKCTTSQQVDCMKANR